MKQLFEFLSALRENNNRDWFEEHRPVYAAVRLDFENLVNEVISGIVSFDPSIGALKAKDCIFRIYRDVRFSHDKSPYKVHMGAYIAGGGRKSPRAGYYFHLEPGNSHVGGGIYRPEPEVLKRIRQEIYFNPEKFSKIIGEGRFVRKFGRLSEEDMLKKAPKEFPADYPYIDLLKYKSYFCGHRLGDAEATSPGVAGKILESFSAMQDLNHFLNHAVESESN